VEDTRGLGLFLTRSEPSGLALECGGSQNRRHDEEAQNATLVEFAWGGETEPKDCCQASKPRRDQIRHWTLVAYPRVASFVGRLRGTSRQCRLLQPQ
jgi:hypothetical protein